MEASNVKPEVKLDPSAPSAKKSVVDTLFDTVTIQTAKGLVVAKDALETVARWLDGRAKLVGDLATKLASTTPGETSTTTESASS
jgi:hypothetical protein